MNAQVSEAKTADSLAGQLRALPRGAWVLFFGTFLNKFGMFVLPFLVIYMTGLGYSAAQSGLAIAAYGVGTICASLMGGWLADRVGRRQTIVLSMSLVAVAMLCLSQARSLGAIIALSGLTGLTGELYRPASTALLADLVPAGQRVTAFAAYRIAINAGFAFGPATAGFLAQYSFLWLFVGNAVTSVLFGLVAWLALPAGVTGAPGGDHWRETFRVLRHDRRFQRALWASLAVGLVFVQVFSTMSLEITRHGFSTATYGLVISLNGLLVVLCELPLTLITRRYPARRVMAVGYVLIGAGFASNAFAHTVPLLVLTTVIFTLGEMISMPVAGAYVADLAPPHQRGLYMGAYGLVWAVAFVCGPSLGLWLFAVNHLAVWAACAVLGVLGAVIIGFTPGRRPVVVVDAAKSPVPEF